VVDPHSRAVDHMCPSAMLQRQLPASRRRRRLATLPFGGPLRQRRPRYGVFPGDRRTCRPVMIGGKSLVDSRPCAMTTAAATGSAQQGQRRLFTTQHLAWAVSRVGSAWTIPKEGDVGLNGSRRATFTAAHCRGDQPKRADVPGQVTGRHIGAQ